MGRLVYIFIYRSAVGMGRWAGWLAWVKARFRLGAKGTAFVGKVIYMRGVGVVASGVWLGWA